MILFMKQKCATICIIGKPNAGKSTLLNYLIGQKIAIVTPKVQTTRSSITGIITEDDTQLIFIDTPGIFSPKKRLEKAMVRCAWSSIAGVDHVILLVDALKGMTEDIQEILGRLEEKGISPLLVLNKVDIKTASVNASISIIHNDSASKEEAKVNHKTFKISALKGTGIDELKSYLKTKAKENPWLYAEDDVTNLPMRFLASEITREQLFMNMQEELPYNLTVETESWENKPDGSAKINQLIIVSKQNYKSMILGNKGEMIKKIGMRARAAIEKDLGIKAHLFLFVKVREEWDNTPANYDYLGLTLEK